MAKNDYRRSLIMLRAHERGYSGHVRLEHRVMMGSMYFTVSEKNASQTRGIQTASGTPVSPSSRRAAAGASRGRSGEDGADRRTAGRRAGGRRKAGRTDG